MLAGNIGFWLSAESIRSRLGSLGRPPSNPCCYIEVSGSATFRFRGKMAAGSLSDLMHHRNCQEYFSLKSIRAAIGTRSARI